MEKHVTKILINAQSSTATHNSLAKKLIAIYVKSDFNEFVTCFLKLLKHPLVHGEKEPTIERTLIFVAKFATSVKSENENKDEEPTTVQEVDDNEEDAEVDPFLVALFEFLLKNHEANSQAVRFRVCQLINRTLNSMGEQASIDDELYSKIYDVMLQRLMDKVPSVRVQAILALARLQDPRNKDCPVIKAYLFHLSMDPNPEVRRAVLNNIAITFQTLPDIIDRTRDVRDLVRKQAYIILAQKVHIRSFTIAQRILLITEGLNDRSEVVRSVVKKNLLQAWLRLVDGNVLDLLKSLDVETSKENAEKVLNCFYEDVSYKLLLDNFQLINRSKVIDYEQLKPESVLYWKSIANHFRSEKADEYIEEILPDLTAFCEYVKEYVQMEETEEADPQDTAMKLMEKDFICQQLISMMALYDLSDEVGRQNLNELIRSLFLNRNLSENCVKELSQIFTLLHAPIPRINQLAEIISDLREPEPLTPESPRNSVHQTPVVQQWQEVNVVSAEEQRKQKVKLAQIRVKMNLAKDELEDCVRSLNLERAQELKIELEELDQEFSNLTKAVARTPQTTPAAFAPNASTEKIPEEEEEAKQLDDPQTMSRCLLIICEVISKSDVTTLNSILRSLHDNLIVPCLKSEDLDVRKFAVKSLVLTCLLSKELAKQHLTLIVQISQMDVMQIQLVAFQGIFDLLQLFGVEEFGDAAGDLNDDPSVVSSSAEDIDEPSNTSNSPNVSNMISLLAKMLETDCSEARTLIAEGLCKLMITSRISSSKLLSLLIIMWYNPVTEDDQMLRHVLGVFFPLYASMGGSNQESISSAMLPTLRTIFKAPLHSPLEDIDCNDVANFLVSITGPAIVSKNVSVCVNMHDTLVFSLCSEILAHPEMDNVRIYVGSLNKLSLTPTNISALKQVEVLCQKMLKKLTERCLLSIVENFHKKVKENLSKALTQEEDLTLTEEATIAGPPEEETTLSQVSTLEKSALRRKRTLYTTVTNMELFSDSDAEPTPLLKKIREPESSAASVSELEDSEVEIRAASDKPKLELNDVKVNLVRLENYDSSDLFVTPESNEVSVEDKTITDGNSTTASSAEEEFEDAETSFKRQKNSSSSSNEELLTPVKKSPRLQESSSSQSPSASSAVSSVLSEMKISSSDASPLLRTTRGRAKKKTAVPSSDDSEVTGVKTRKSKTAATPTTPGRVLRGRIAATPDSVSSVFSGISRTSTRSSLKSSDHNAQESSLKKKSKTPVRKMKRRVSPSSQESDSSQERVSRSTTRRSARKVKQ